jgi:hypothetical protein
VHQYYQQVGAVDGLIHRLWHQGHLNQLINHICSDLSTFVVLYLNRFFFRHNPFPLSR